MHVQLHFCTCPLVDMIPGSHTSSTRMRIGAFILAPLAAGYKLCNSACILNNTCCTSPDSCPGDHNTCPEDGGVCPGCDDGALLKHIAVVSFGPDQLPSMVLPFRFVLLDLPVHAVGNLVLADLWALKDVLGKCLPFGPPFRLLRMQWELYPIGHLLHQP